jgi:hypothetical protein
VVIALSGEVLLWDGDDKFWILRRFWSDDNQF